MFKLTNEVKEIGICPTVDFAFKSVLGSPDHERVTIHFLNAVLGLPIRIRRVTIRNPFLGQEADDDKLAILDILAVDEQGRLINIEMQTNVPAGMRQRLTFYVSTMYSSQLTEGDAYTSLRPAISLCVLTKPMYVNDARLHLDFRLRETSGLVLTDDLQVRLLQLSNLAVTAQNVSKASLVEQWASFFLNAETMTPADVRQLFHDDEFSEAAGVLEMISKNSEQRQLYDARLKLQRDEAARLEAARNEGIEKGIEKGRDKGLREGIEKGELFGRIRILQNLLGMVESSRDELSNSSVSQLSQLLEELKG